MTLVTVEFSERNITISADTLLTSPKRHGLERDGTEKSAVPGGLKVFILSANYCLCCAGVYSVGLQLLRKIFELQVADNLSELKKLIDIQHRISNQCDSTATDFLLCLRKERECLIWRNGGFLNTKEDCYIGSSDSYNAIDPESTDRRHIDDLTDNPNFPTVGGLVLSVSDNNKYFYYSHVVSFYVQDPENADPSFGYQWVSISPNVAQPRMGVYFLGANFGYLYNPLLVDDAVIVKAETVEEFKRKAELKDANYIKVPSEMIVANSSVKLE